MLTGEDVRAEPCTHVAAVLFYLEEFKENKPVLNIYTCKYQKNVQYLPIKDILTSPLQEQNSMMP